MFFDFLLATLPENVAAIVTKLSVDGQWLWDHVIKYARWQYPALGAERGLRCLAPRVFHLIYMLS